MTLPVTDTGRHRSSLLRRLLKVEGVPIAIVYLILVVTFMILAPRAFLGYRTHMTLFASVSMPMIVALGLTLVIVAGEMDLSFPAMIAASGWVFCAIFQFDGNAWLALVFALAVGTGFGLMNGLIVTLLGIPSFIVTLATLFLWGGLVVVLSNGLSLSIPTVVDTTVFHLIAGRIGVFPVQFLWAIGIGVLTWFILNRHRFGEALLFIGDKPEVARVMGISIDATRIKLFTLMGFLSSFGGIVLTLESNNFFSNQGMGYLLIVVASVFIGGTSIFGGSGTVVGTVFGALIVGIIEVGLVASGFQGFWTHVLIGAVFLLSVSVNTILEDPDRVPIIRWARNRRS